MQDVHVKYDDLNTIQNKLQLIAYDLKSSGEQMLDALSKSESFLSGYQFEKAKGITKSCLQISGKAESNVHGAIDYIRRLMACLDEYGNLRYAGDIK